jgi:XTP/dITP diphosphohydrolase
VRGVVDVTFVSTNRGKYLEAREILRPYGVRLRWLRRSLTEPQAADLRVVAEAKVRSVLGVRGYILVEDSGLFIRGLNGFPGVYSAHFLEIWGFPPILELLRRRSRAAAFRCVAALRQGRTVRSFVGEVAGSIAPRASGRGGFGYDPIFVPRGHRRTFGQLPAETKNAFSHRARAMEQVGRFLARARTARPRGRAPRRRRRAARRVRPAPRPVISSGD